MYLGGSRHRKQCQMEERSSQKTSFEWPHCNISQHAQIQKLGLVLYCNLITANSTNHIKPANRCRDFHLNSANSLRL